MRGPSSLDKKLSTAKFGGGSHQRRKEAQGVTLVPVLPCITISRQFGALGGALGKALAEEVGIYLLGSGVGSRGCAAIRYG